MKRIAIIGGGPGGLLTAYLLSTRGITGYRATIFESASQAGGKLKTRCFPGTDFRYEAGAAEIYDYRIVGDDPFHDLIDELGLNTTPLSGQTVHMDGTVIRQNNDNDIVKHWGLETLVAVRDFHYRTKCALPRSEWHPGSHHVDNNHEWANRSCTELLQTVQNLKARKYLRTVVHTDIATDPHATNGLNGLKNFVLDLKDYLEYYAINGGMSCLADQLITRTSNTDFELGARVYCVSKPTTNCYRIHFERNGQKHHQDFDAMVIAMPVSPLIEIEWADESLQRAMDQHIAHFDHPGHYLRVSLLFKEIFWRDVLEGAWHMVEDFGGACIYDESLRFDHGGHGVLGFLLAGAPALNVANLEKEEIISRVLNALPASLKEKARSTMIDAVVHRWAGAISGQPGGLPQMDPIDAHLPDPQRNPNVIMVGDYLFDSTLNGVHRSANIATDLLMVKLSSYSHAA